MSTVRLNLRNEKLIRDHIKIVKKEHTENKTDKPLLCETKGLRFGIIEEPEESDLITPGMIKVTGGDYYLQCNRNRLY